MFTNSIRRARLCTENPPTAVAGFRVADATSPSSRFSAASAQVSDPAVEIAVTEGAATDSSDTNGRVSGAVSFVCSNRTAVDGALTYLGCGPRREARWPANVRINLQIGRAHV